jgi:hypothetical protein
MAPVGDGRLPCVSPTPYLGDDSGFVSCDGGFVHRARAGKCEPSPRVDGRYPAVTPGGEACSGDSDCGENLRCFNLSQPPFPQCIETCEVDDDCGSGQICLCNEEVNHCVNASCTTDADCGPEMLCTNFRAPCGVDLGIFVCQQQNDECTASCSGGTCTYRADETGGSRLCMPGAGGSCGRPFLIEGHETRATARSSADWLDPRALAPCLDELEPALRRALAVQWRDAALMEHASIAAFARFTLELLALGAPPSLVADATEAMADEQSHATLCFALASAYAGAPLGPGPLDVRGCLGELELASVVVTTFLEGCIGETIAAVEARELARRVTDPALERALSRIAADESRHAALAWRFVHWALERGGTTLVARLRAELALAQAAAEAAASHAAPERTASNSDEAALAHGLVPPAFRSELRRSALSEIVAPCLEALADFARIAEDSRESAA